MADQIERKKGKGSRPCRWFRFLPLLVAALCFLGTTPACGALKDATDALVGPQWVLVDEQDVPPNVDAMLPTQVEVVGPDGVGTGRVFVVIDEKWLPAETPRLRITEAPVSPDVWATLVSNLLGPTAGVGVWAILKILLSRRARGHMAEAGKAVAKLQIGTAMKRIAAAEGFFHTAEVAPNPQPSVAPTPATI